MIAADFISEERLQACRALPIPEFGSSAPRLHNVIDHAAHVLLPLIQIARGDRDADIGLENRANWNLWDKLVTSETTAGLTDEKTLRGLMLYHNNFVNEINPYLGPSQRKTPISADKTKLVYSFIYHMCDPEHTVVPVEAVAAGLQKTTYRQEIAKMLGALGLGNPLTESEVIDSSQQLQAIAKNQIEINR